MDELKRLKKVIDDLEMKIGNSHKMLDVIWNNAIVAAMDQFGVEHKPRCNRVPCQACAVRDALKPLLRDTNLNRKEPREIIGEFMGKSLATKKFIGKDKKAYIQGIHDLFEELITRGIV